MTIFFPAFIGLFLFPVSLLAVSQIFRNMNASVDPCDNFYEFACGGWKGLHSLSDVEKKGWISETTEAREKMVVKLKTLLETPLNVLQPDIFQFAVSAYSSCMDLETIEASDARPLRNILYILRGWPVVEGDQWNESKFDWLDMLIKFRNLGFKFNIFYFNITIIERATSRHVGLQWEMYNWLIGGKLYELRKTGAYFSRMHQSAEMLGANLYASENELFDVLNFEKYLNNIRPSNWMKLIYSVYQTRKTVTQLEELLPQFPWRKLFGGMFNIKPLENEMVVVDCLRCFFNLIQLINNTPKRTVANYMIWKVVEQSLPFLSSNWASLLLVDTDIPKKQPRSEHCLDYVKQPNTLRDSIDSYYVKKFVGSGFKKSAIEVVEYVRREYINMLENNNWLDISTKELLIDKALNMDIDNVGFPGRLLNETYLFERYGNMDIFNKSYLEVDLHLRKAHTDYRFGKLRKPITKNEFENYLAVTDVNGFASHVNNAIEIPIGFLELLFHNNRPQYLNFGALGFISGHEIAHHFISLKNLDKNGVRKEWPPATEHKYFLKSHCFVNQYNNYMEENGMKINGLTTIKENMADTDGFKTAYRAYQTWVEEHGNEKLLYGLNYTQNQLFWLSGANELCAKYSSWALEEQIKVGVHSTERFRVIGSMSNIPEFSRDFNCPYGSQMNRIDKCSLY